MLFRNHSVRVHMPMQGDKGRLSGQRRWMRCDDASWGMQNRRLAGALPGTRVGITPTIRNSRNSNKKIGIRERKSARTETMTGWGLYDQPPPMEEITDTGRRTRSRSRSFSAETRSTHKVEVLDRSFCTAVTIGTYRVCWDSVTSKGCSETTASEGTRRCWGTQ